MMTGMSNFKGLKYRLLRNLPGKHGTRYARQYLAYDAVRQFHVAVKETSGLTSIDLGANLGKYTALMAEHASEVFAFEPDPWTASALRSNLSGFANVTIVEAAAAASDGRALLYRHAEFEANPSLFSELSSLVADKQNVAQTNPVEVRQIDFIRFLRELDRDVGVLKIDIEGAEVDLLERLLTETDLLGRVRHIFAETHETRIPHHGDRVVALREAAANISNPKINLFWK